MSYLQILAKCPLAKCPDTAPIPHQPSLKSTGLERWREPYKNHKNTNTDSTNSIPLITQIGYYTNFCSVSIVHKPPLNIRESEEYKYSYTTSILLIKRTPISYYTQNCTTH